MKKRPIGISIVAFLYIFIGMISLITEFFVSTYHSDMIDMVINHMEWITLLLMGIGLTLEKRWAWWLTVFLLTFSVFYNLYALIDFKSILLNARISQSDSTKYFYKTLATTVFQSLIILYLFQRNVFEYFRFEYVTKYRKLKILLGINLLIIFFTVLINKLL